MGECIYCHQPAGLFHTKHRNCETRHEAGVKRIVQLAQEAMRTGADLSELDNHLRRVASASLIPEDRIPPLLIKGWEAAVDAVLQDGVLTLDEEKALDAAQKHYNWTQEDVNRNGAYTRLVEAGVLRDVLEDGVSQRLKVQGQLPFNFTRGEQLIWLFPQAQYYEIRTRRSYVGGYQGVSIRVARGVYYRTGGFRGNPVDTTEVSQAFAGAFAITDKYLYFSGGVKAFRIPYKKIVAFTPYSDGIGIQRDASTAKPQAFVTGDGWFTYNLVVNLASLQAGRVSPEAREDSERSTDDADGFPQAVVGESHYQDVIESICGGRKPDGEDLVVDASLVPEDANPYDSNAVKVVVQGKTVGYLSRPSARRFRERFAKAGVSVVTCKARIRGGWDRGPDDRGNYGVALNLTL